MPFSGGVYTAPANSWNPAVSGTTISATDWAAQLADYVTAWNTCLLKDGTQTATASVPFAFNLTAGVAGTRQGTIGFNGATSGTTTLSGPATGTNTLTLPAATDTLVGKATTDELTNKTLTSSVGKGTWTASGTWTLPAFTLGGTVTATGQQITDGRATTTFGVGAAAPAASGAGISFPATQSSSSDANTLDDYEEGTWTPAYTFATAGDLSVVYSQQTGLYTKIGDTVVIHYNARTSTFNFTTASGLFRITGIPFTAISTSDYFSAQAGIFQGITNATYNQYAPYVTSSSTFMNVGTSNSAQGFGNVAAADMPTGGTVNFRGSLTYKTAT